jgi:type VI secretion system secreted protein VgrG
MIARTDHGDDGQITTDIAYDALGRPVERRSSDGSHASYRYDERGLLTQAQASSPGQTPSQITFEYDAAGRRTAEVQAHHGRVWRLAHELDALGHRSESRIPGAGTLNWQRYGSGHVHGVLVNGMTLASFERDALHRETLRVQGPAAHHFGYSPAGQLAQHDWQHLNARGESLEPPRPWRNWTHDRAGQITALRDEWRGEKRYGYDPLARLTDVSGSRYGDETFTYDPAGNLLAVGSAGWIGLAQGDRLHSLVTPEIGAPQALLYEHDGHGNRVARTVPLPPSPEPTAKDNFVRVMDTLTGVQKPPTEPQPHVTRYRYDGVHQLAAIDHDDGAQTRYAYDALGRRIAKHHAPAGGGPETTLFVWDDDWMLQEVRARSDAPDESRIVYVPHPDHAGPLAKVEGGVTYHYVTDHLGTPQELYDDQREIVWAVDFSAYGKTRGLLASEVVNPIRFPGQYYDEESGLHYNRFRYYDPQAGRYVSQDPIGLRGGWNQYGYARGNPFSRVDPTGLQHVSGQWKDCGKGCRIRIDRDASGGGRHLHWECKKSSGTMGEFGGVSHGDDYNSAPNAIKECARKNGFEPEPTKQPCPNNSSSAVKNIAEAGAWTGVGYIAYRVIRMLPSLIPIFWETIPLNAALP